MVVIIFLLGLIIGSFLNVLIYRLPKSETILGRSYCPKCKRQIKWYDNVPVLSYLILGGMCRNCKKEISLIYPTIEIITGILFVLVWYFFTNCRVSLNPSPLCYWTQSMNFLALPFLLFLVSALVCIFIIDLKQMLILDSFVFISYSLILLILIMIHPEYFWTRILSGFLASLFLLLLHLATKGKGMGLGDVKLALFMGTFLGGFEALTWMFLSFIIGAAVGIILIIFRLKKFRAEVPFGPFMIIAFFVTMILEKNIFNLWGF